MTKFILVLALLFSAPAFAGVKFNTGIENYEAVVVSTSICNKTYIGGVETSSDCSFSVESKRVSALKLGVSYEMELNDKLGVEAGVGINSMTNGSAELNGTYKINKKIKAKAGINTSKDLSNKTIANVKPGIGVQAGAEYALNDRLSLVGTLGTKSQSYQINDAPDSFNDTTITGNVGLSFSF